jgi:fluoroquinolone transport system permease protein
VNSEHKKLLRIIAWDIRFALRYHIITVAIVITMLYTFIFKIIPGADIMEVLVSLIFSDPSMLGFIFVGAMVLFEKDANTLQALTVTPVKPWQYLWSKAISLTLIALVCSIGMAYIGHGFGIRLIFFIPAVVLTSFIFTFIGFIGVSRVKNFNQYIILIPLFLLPTILPLADFYGIVRSPVFYLIPTHGSLLLFKAAFKEVGSLNILYSVVILCITVWITYRIAERHYLKYIVGKTNNKAHINETPRSTYYQ